MDKLAKLLKKLSKTEREHLEEILTLLTAGNAESLDIKKLKGTNNVYRAGRNASRHIPKDKR